MTNSNEPRETWEEQLLKKCPRYKYGQLNPGQKTIRLFKVLNRGIFQDAIFVPDALVKEKQDPAFRLANERVLCPFIAIQEFHIEEAPKFTTLSYCWGDNSQPKRAVFTSYEWSTETSADPTAHLWVSENLYRAIRQIVVPTDEPDGWWWADAICIDQEDDIEKTWQVNMMWNIYKKSHQTMCWLGEAEGSEDMVVDSLFAYWYEWAQAPRTNAHEIDWILPDGFDLAGLQKFVNMPYWGRAWVQQEVNGQDFDDIWIMCGRKKTHIKMVAMLSEGIGNRVRQIMQHISEGNDYGIGECEKQLLDIQASEGFARMDRLIRSSPTGNMRYLYILHQWLRLVYLHGQGVAATDGRDLIFALYNMSREREPDVYKADYSKSCRDVYIETAKTFSAQGWRSVLMYRNDPMHRFEDELSLAGIDDKATKQSALMMPRDLPSWVPNWRCPIKPAYHLSLPAYTGNTEHQFSAGKRIQDPSQEEKDSLFTYSGDTMIVQAVVAGKVVKTTQPLAQDTNASMLQSAQRILRQLDILIKFFAVEKIPRKSSHIWQIPILDAEISPKLDKLGRATAISSAAYDTLKRMRLTPARYDDNGINHEVMRYCEVMFAACENRRFFLTDNGYVGLGMTSVKTGDEVAVVEGVDAPIVLGAGSAGDYVVVSDAFVDGLMYGELWKDEPATKAIRLC